MKKKPQPNFNLFQKEFPTGGFRHQAMGKEEPALAILESLDCFLWRRTKYSYGVYTFPVPWR